MKRTTFRTSAACWMACAAAACASTVLAAGPTTRPYAIAPDVASGVYAVGQPITWTIDWTGADAPPAARYTLMAGQLRPIDEGEVQWSGNRATVTTSLDAPGSVLLKVAFDGPATQPAGEASRRTGVGGAIVAAERIALAAPKPDDFDAFWAAKLKELSDVPTNPQLAPSDSGKPGVNYAQVTMDNVRGIKIRGQIARPTAGEKFPALLVVQWAGVYGLDRNWVTDRAGDGWLVLNISPHDLPTDRPPAFYKDQFDGPLKNYWMIGNDDRDQSYFLHMYLSCYRAVDYLAQRPDWDGKTLVVIGGSQGGQQSLVTAAIQPEKITAALAGVPAGCDMLGPTVGRRGGWPQWYDNTWGGRDAAKVRDASRYYDVANFTPRIRCPVLIGAGLIDETCPAEGIMAAVNQITSPKRVVLLPFGAHQNENNSHRAYEDLAWRGWLPSLVKGVVPTTGAQKTDAPKAAQ